MVFDVDTPLLGFENFKQFELEKIDDIFMRLKAIDKEEPSFTLINPFILRDYEFDIPTSVQDSMQINDSSNILILNMVIISTKMEKSTINFAAPMIFNTDNKKMVQIILSDSNKYSISEPISGYLNV